MQGKDRPSLKGSLDLLTRDENPPRKGTLTEEYIILRRFDVRKGFVYVEFVDGDEKDDKEWFEGPVPECMSIGALFAMRDETDRGTRREAYGRMKLLDKAGDEVLTEEKSKAEAPQKPTIMEEMIARNTVELTAIQGKSRKNTDEYEVDGSSCAGSRSSADTEKGPSRAMSAKRAKTCPDMQKSTMNKIDSASRD
jgi:hypothetical protein